MLERAEAAPGLSLGLEGVPSVRIEPGRGRDWATHVRIAEWEGPLGLLLSLIEARRLTCWMCRSVASRGPTSRRWRRSSTTG